MGLDDVIAGLVQGLPIYIVILVIGLLGIFFSQPDRTFWGNKLQKPLPSLLSITGWLLFPLGLFLTIIITLLKFWEGLEPYHQNIGVFFSTVIDVIFHPISVILLFLVLVIVFLYKTKDDKGISVEVIPVNPDEHYIGLQISTNSTKGFECLVRLVNIIQFDDVRENIIEGHEINPYGYYFGWPGHTDRMKIVNGAPRVVNIAQTYTGEGVRLVFPYGKYSKPMNYKYFYRIRLEILENKGNNKFDLLETFEGEFGLEPIYTGQATMIRLSDIVIFWITE